MHMCTELPEARTVVKQIIGEAKRKSSRAVKEWLPGSVWAAGGEYVICNNRGHLRNAVDYVLYDQGPGAWTWSYQMGRTKVCLGASVQRRLFGAEGETARGGADALPRRDERV